MKNNEREEFFLLYYNQVKAYAYAITREWHAAEDIASETFCKFMSLKIDESKSVRYWLLKVARNLIYNEKRRAKRLVPIKECGLAAPDGGQIEKIIADESYAALYKALGLLDARLREIVTLFYFEDMSIADIGELTGNSEANVKVMLFRGRQKLKKFLEE
ncbi:MAG: sigma-70 family RNA polymerase sigma factor [Clostridiales bacterium]|jgi:RNA polymerase sigma-70 factor (ECF subfamily)|nr:sigma-70 family RNA polymerase sigma factor [Clostridiales bacterium]